MGLKPRAVLAAACLATLTLSVLQGASASPFSEGPLVQVSGASPIPAACIGDTKAFIAAFFPGGTFTCSQGYAGCKFNFEYSSPDKSLVFHHWQDKGTNGVTEQFTGDIANS